MRVLERLRARPAALVALAVVAVYALVAVLVQAGVLASAHDARVGAKYLGPSADFWFGTDRQGRDIFARALYGTKIAVSVGLVSAGIAVTIGSIIGAVAGYFGGKLDLAIVWLYSTVQSIPYLLLLMALTFVAGRGVFGLYVAFAATYWVAPCRMVRGEAMKLREMGFIQAARALGYSDLRILFAHVLPNVFHVVFVSFSLLFISAIKAEVILSYLGLGVRGEPSWGTMIDQARAELINGFFWQIGAATGLMFGLVFALNVVTDALSDAFDPRSPAG